MTNNLNLRDFLNVFSDNIINELDSVEAFEDWYRLDFSYKDPDEYDLCTYYSIYLYNDGGHSLNVKFNGRNNYKEEMIVDYHIAEMYLDVVKHWLRED